MNLYIPGVQIWNGYFRQQMVHQSGDTVPFCCLINKCQTCTNDKFEKRVHSVVLLCSIWRYLYRTKSISWRHSFFVFIWRKLLLNRTDYFEELMVNMPHRKIRVNNCFGVSKVLTSIQDKKEDQKQRKPPKKLEYVELKALLDEEVSQTQKQLWAIKR